MHIVERRSLWFSISAIAIAPGLLFMLYFMITTGVPLPLSIDYTGGTLWEMAFVEQASPVDVREVFVKAGYPDTIAFNVEDSNRVQVKLKDISIPEKDALEEDIQAAQGDFEDLSFRKVGPSIGTEVSRAAIFAVALASFLILLYIAFAFRSISHPFRYGTCAVIALVHDVLVTITFVCIMYFVAGWEVDALFLTAILTVIGFSVNDTIVIFDRLRENVKRHRSESFATIADRSIVETAQRSIATQVTALLILVAILVLGGASLRQFMATMIVGLVSGTYSSIFNATPLLVAWEEGSFLGRKKKPTNTVTNGNTAPA